MDKKLLEINRISTESIPKKIVLDENKKITNIDKKLKSPICAFMGHVDAGKTSLIDIIKNSKVQESEPGNITQNISSTFIDIDNMISITKEIKGKFEIEPTVPGILILDTPGHEVFNSFRETSASLCDIVVLVIDIFDGVKPQTIESINILKNNKIPFVIAATKIDKVDNYNNNDETSLKKAFKLQEKSVVQMIVTYIEDLKYDLSKHNINAEFYSRNTKPKNVYSIIPISCKTKNGLADLLALVIYLSQNWMNKKILYKDKVDATVMECRQDKKMGWILNLILSNGTLNTYDKYYVIKNNEIKQTSVRKIYDTSNFNLDCKSLRASKGAIILGSNLENVVVGTKLYTNKKEAENNRVNLDKYKLCKEGVSLQAPTLGCLDALYKLFSKNNIPIMNVSINKIFERDLNNLESKLDKIEDKEFRCLVYYDTMNLKEEERIFNIAENKDIYFICSNIIYELLELYKDFRDSTKKKRIEQMEELGEAIFPCKIKILKDFVFKKSGDVLIFGIKVTHGRINVGMPLFINLEKKSNSIKVPQFGKILSIEKNNESLTEATIDDEVCIKVENPENLIYDRNFYYNSDIYSLLTRKSINLLKKDYRDKLSKNDWLLVIDIIKILDIKK